MTARATPANTAGDGRPCRDDAGRLIQKKHTAYAHQEDRLTCRLVRLAGG